MDVMCICTVAMHKKLVDAKGETVVLREVCAEQGWVSCGAGRQLCRGRGPPQDFLDGLF